MTKPTLTETTSSPNSSSTPCRRGRRSDRGRRRLHLRARLLEGKLAICGVDSNRVSLAEFSFEDLQRQLVDQLLLDHPLQRSGAVGRVVAEVAQQGACIVC